MPAFEETIRTRAIWRQRGLIDPPALATETAMTANTIPTPDIELELERLEYAAINKIRVVLKTSDGETVTYIMKTRTLMQSIRASVDLLNSNKLEFFRDLGM